MRKEVFRLNFYYPIKRRKYENTNLFFIDTVNSITCFC